MQVVVWLAFFCTMAAAAGVIHWRQSQHRLPLTPPQSLAGLEIPLPQGWMSRTGEKLGARFLVASEQPGRGTGRTLVVIRRLVPAGTTAADVLEQHVALDNPGFESQLSTVKTFNTSLGEWTMVEQQGMLLRRGSAPERRLNVMAAAISPEGEALLLQVSGSVDASGVLLVRDLAKSMKIAAPLVPVPDGSAI